MRVYSLTESRRYLGKAIHVWDDKWYENFDDMFAQSDVFETKGFSWWSPGATIDPIDQRIIWSREYNDATMEWLKETFPGIEERSLY